MAEVASIVVAGEALELHADRALFWPSHRRLVIADLHLGKSDAFRRAGIAVPSGGSRDDLARLSVLLAATGAETLWILGDVLHGDPAPRRWRDAWEAFRAAFPALAIVVIAGNHDRALPRAGLDVRIEARPLHDGPFVFAHAPAPVAGGYVLAGHLHPVLQLPGLRRRFPAFVFDAAVGVLPAFSLFTGGTPMAPGAAVRRFACVDGDLVALPAPNANRVTP